MIKAVTLRLRMVADSAKSIFIENPKAAWELLENRFGPEQHGLQSVLMPKLYLKWDGNGTTHSIVDLHTALADAGMTTSDQSFHEYFMNLLPSSLDLFITLYDDPTYDIDLLCGKFAKYEM